MSNQKNTDHPLGKSDHSAEDITSLGNILNPLGASLGQGSATDGAIPSVASAASPLTGIKKGSLFDRKDNDYSAWDEAEPKRQRRINPIFRAFIYIGIGLLSFLVFIYLTFPYGVIKEVLVGQISDSMKTLGYPVRVSIGSLRPHWLTGLQLKEVKIVNSTDSAASVTLNEITLRANLLPLVWGTLHVTGKVTQSGGGVDLSLDLPLFSLIKGNLASPSEAQIVFKSFAIDPFINHVLAVAKGSKDPSMVLILPLLQTTTIGGALDGSIQLDNPEVSHFTKAKGGVKLKLLNGFFHINDNTLKIPKQDFKEANIELGFENNAVLVKELKFKAEDISVGLAGRVALPEMAGNPPQAELELDLGMHGEIEKNLGFIVPNLMRCKPLTAGELKAKLSGPLSQMACL
jgi:type II secretion system protein N